MAVEPTFDLAACLAGHKAAWDRFVDRFSGVIYAAVRRTLMQHGRPSPQLIEDITQDVFVRLFRDDYKLLRSFDPARASLTTWLTIISRSVAIDALRAHRPAVPLDERLHDRPVAPDTAAAATLELPAVLSPAQKRVLEMLFDREMTVEEAAAELQVDPQTVRSTKHKALDKLRRFFTRGRPPDS
jgi:RNA polymerase sigma-70 factor (ECF subfamily)